MMLYQEGRYVYMTNESGNESLPWPIVIFEKTNLRTVVDAFGKINQYWAWLPLERRLKIWGAYREIWMIFQEISSTPDVLRGGAMTRSTLGQLIESCAPIVKELYDQMPMAELERWVELHGQIKHPDTLKDELDAEDTVPDKTYLKSDYRGLVVLTIALRPMVPIWGWFLSLIQKETKTTYKEYKAMGLLSQTSMITSQPVLRLKRYIEATIGSSPSWDDKMAAAILDGLSSADLPDWILGLVMVRRMALGEVDAGDTRGSIISNIYSFIFYTLRELDKKFGGVKEKNPQKGDDDPMQDQSRLEAYNKAEDLPAGDRAGFGVYAEKPLALARHMEPDIPEDLVEICVKHAHLQDIRPIEEAQMQLMSWVLCAGRHGKGLPSQAMDYITKRNGALLNCMGVTQALLLHWELPLLAAVVTAAPMCMEEGVMTDTMGLAKITPRYMEQLQKLYPYTLPEGGTKGNPAVVQIQRQVSLLNEVPWVCTMPEVLLKRYPAIELDMLGRIRLHPHQDPISLGDRLARLVILINQ